MPVPTESKVLSPNSLRRRVLVRRIVNQMASEQILRDLHAGLLISREDDDDDFRPPVQGRPSSTASTPGVLDLDSRGLPLAHLTGSNLNAEGHPEGGQNASTPDVAPAKE